MAVTKLAPPWIAWPELQRLFAALGAPVLDVRCVGGSVRDAAIGLSLPRTEIDIGTPEPPDRVMARLKDARIKCIPTGLDHGTVTAVVEGRTFEITSLRRDTACDGRHAAVEFTTDWREDARRRDFTFNAMSMALDGIVHDDHGGLDDARAGRVRFVGDPDDRIQEDYLRILRLFRFAALYGREPITPAVLDACRRHKAGLARLSAERIHDELAKLLAAADPVPAMMQMHDCGVLGAIIPESTGVDVLQRLIAAEQNVPRDCALNISINHWPRRLAALVAAPSIDGVATRLKLSNDERVRLMRAWEGAALMPATAPLDLRPALFHRGAEAVMDRALLSRASTDKDEATGWRDMFVEICRWTPQPLPVRGEDVLALGIPPGPGVGQVLAAMTDWWIAADFKPSRADALAELERWTPKR